MVGDHPDIPFLQAEKYSTGRPDGPPLWVVIHTMEEDELGDTAERVANYFAYNTGTRSVSSHYCADNNSIVQCVRLADSAWTVGNRPGNYRGINWELAGRAAQTAAQWADDYSQAMLRRIAPIIARDMARYGIPNRWCTVAELQARRPGLTTHNDLRLAFGGTTHTDPGAAFPRAQLSQFISGAQSAPASPTQEDNMFHGQVPPGQTPIVVCTPWNKSSISFGCDFGKAKLRVAEHVVNVGWKVYEVTVDSNDQHRYDLGGLGDLRANVDRRCIMRVPLDANDKMTTPVGYLAWWA